jgi:hypothetical protein
MAKKKVFLAGEVFKIGDTFIVEEMCMQMTLDDWLGKGNVTVKLNKPNDDEVEITIFRKYGSFYSPTSFELQPPIFRSIFEYDKQIILGTNYQIGGRADLTIYEGRYINYYGLEDFYKEYRKHARELKATRPKEILFIDDFNFMKLTLKY